MNRVIFQHLTSEVGEGRLRDTIYLFGRQENGQSVCVHVQHYKPHITIKTNEKQEDFETLYDYSPLHNVKAGVEYPPMIITTGDYDDRVVPSHSFKLAATLQHAYPEGNPIVLRVDINAGHGGGKRDRGAP